MKNRVLILIIFISNFNLLNAQINIGRPIEPGFVLGVQIQPDWYGAVQYYEAFYTGYRFTNFRYLDKNQFMIKASTPGASMANMDTNLFVYYGVQHVTVVDSLWKLIFAKYPLVTKNVADTIGWANNKELNVPSHRQKQILYEIGMDTVYFTIFGENLFLLLKLLNNPSWVERYKNAQ